ncbi:MAG: S41 family peptidase [Blastocatellia bacterium]|nr:S41 family peptidase [Blastocatellia bacterium]
MNQSGQKRKIAILFAIITCAAITLTPLVQAQDAARQKLIDQYQKAMEIIRDKYAVELDDQALTKLAIQGMLKSLDPHSDYMDRVTFKDFLEKQNSEYYGIGSYVRTINQSTYIVEPFKGSPASRAGLRYGDQIVAINGVDTSKWPSDKVSEKLLGPRGTQVTVAVKRLGTAEPITAKITRDSIYRPSIPTFYLIKPNIGYIGLTRSFQSTTSEELEKAMEFLRQKGADRFILDIRNNNGGYLDQAIRVCDQFLQRGQTIVSVRGRSGRNNNQTAVAENGTNENFPLIVMIDRYSASASEIVAGAIQDHDRGLILGERSFGKGLVQGIFPLPDSGALILTIAHYYTPSGRLIQRDYSNGSIFDYYYRRNFDGAQTNPHDDEKKTDLGRPVYGGGGIDPDIKVDNPAGFTPVQVRLYDALRLFVRDLVAGQVAGFERFKLNGITYDYDMKGNEYLVTDDLMKPYREFVAKFYKANPEYGITAAMIDEEANLVWARNQIRQEVLTAAYGEDRAQQGMSGLDVQLQRAVAEMPKAEDLSLRSWRHNRTSIRR